MTVAITYNRKHLVQWKTRGSDASLGSYKLVSFGDSRLALVACTGFQMKAPLDSAQIGRRRLCVSQYKSIILWCLCSFRSFSHQSGVDVTRFWGNITTLPATGNFSWTNCWTMITFTDVWANYMKIQLTESEMQMLSNCLKEKQEWWALLDC